MVPDSKRTKVEGDCSSQFRATWGATLGWISASTVVLFIGFPLILLAAGGNQMLILALLGWAITLGLLSWAFLSQFIRRYVISGDQLVVERFGAETVFALESLQSIEEDPTAMVGTYVMSNGGLFAFTGKRCRSRKLGVYEAYATDRKNCVILRFPDRTLVITPENPTSFVEILRSSWLS
ncbi:MAG: hypothetical protein CMQ20_12725 [Gammaproteobacteria bacterium]|jgi:hypothetical protein|nr:hypothetical protein [Gammaproteobacteria bacterium]|tara:strand:+ start:1122 stop:1661 length:540 start_codon:yes stop_codon:yes gene_type:complete